jgi:hypothetical protein
MTEVQAVFLIALVAQLSHVVVDDAVLLCKVNNFHVFSVLVRCLCKGNTIAQNKQKKHYLFCADAATALLLSFHGGYAV